MPKKKVVKRYFFILKNLNIESINNKYGLSLQSNIDIVEESIPEETTKITDLFVNKNTPEVISFLDESKRKKTCNISMIDFRSNQTIQKENIYNCFWDHHIIPNDITPLGCPIRYVPHKAVKTYFSEISQDTYVIKEDITKYKSENTEEHQDDRIKINKRGYYETDGVFCSFNCMAAFIEENEFNPMYKDSYKLMIKMYNQMHQENIELIDPSPHYRKLITYGGNLDIIKFRESFNKVLYKYHGIIKIPKIVPIGHLYEEQFKF